MNGENRTLRVFSALGIMFIVAGHLRLNFFELGGLFPYYAFHVYIFIFVSGYFYNSDSEKEVGKYIIKKAKQLLAPYFIWNLVYGIIATSLNNNGFMLGGSMSLYNMFIAPFDGGHQFMLNAPSWFLIALFEVEAVNILMRAVLNKLKINNDIILFSATLIVGILVVYLAITGHVWGFYRDVARILIMLPGFYLGLIYRKYIIKLIPDSKIKRLLFDVGICVVAALVELLLKANLEGLSFSTVWVSSFANGPFVPFVTVILGITFWLSIADAIVIALSGNAFTMAILENILIVGRNTKSIMLHHIFIFFSINSVLYMLNLSKGLYPGFDIESYHTDVYYAYDLSQRFLWGYLIIGILICVCLGIMYDKIKKKFFKALKENNE